MYEYDMDCDMNCDMNYDMNCDGTDMMEDEMSTTVDDRFRRPEPYPKVCVGPEDKKWLPLIFEDYAGYVSELTAASQYVFYNIVIKNDCPKELAQEIARVFHGIGVVEMTHFDLFGTAIRKMGGTPKFHDGCGKMWDGGEVPYAIPIKKCLQLAIKGEEDAIRQYSMHAKRITNVSLKKLLCRIVRDEQLHRKIFMCLLRKLCC